MQMETHNKPLQFSFYILVYEATFSSISIVSINLFTLPLLPTGLFHGQRIVNH